MNRFALALALTLAALPALAETPRVKLHVTFDPAAAADLAKRGEMVVIASYFYGFPAPGATLQADEVGQINLGNEEFYINPADTTVEAGGSLIAAPLDQVSELMLNVNVFSARLVHEDNLLDCTLLPDETVSKMTGTQEITCKLLPR